MTRLTAPALSVSRGDREAAVSGVCVGCLLGVTCTSASPHTSRVSPRTYRVLLQVHISLQTYLVIEIFRDRSCLFVGKKRRNY